MYVICTCKYMYLAYSQYNFTNFILKLKCLYMCMHEVVNQLLAEQLHGADIVYIHPPCTHVPTCILCIDTTCHKEIIMQTKTLR